MSRPRGVRKLLKSIPKVSGVYMITHIPTGRRYIGFSKNIDEGVRHRVAQHFDDLVRGRHPTRLMQDVWNYDPIPEHWTAELLEETTDWARERVWMDAFGIPNEHDFNKARCLK